MNATLVTGGTGFIGSHLLSRLERPLLTTRNVASAQRKVDHPNASFIQWNPATDALALPLESNIDSVVNLMGESIAEGRWTEAKKNRIVASRVDATRNLVDSLLKLSTLPKVMVAASATGIYGDAKDELITEDHKLADGFLAGVCRDWEAENSRLTEHGVRVVLLRIGIVMGRDGGALKKLIPMFKWGLGGKLGQGKQWTPWIHVTDLAAMIEWAIKTDTISGAVNAVAPNPVTNETFTRSLATALNRFAILPAPRFGLKLVLGEFADSLLNSQRAVPTAALENDFQFAYPELRSALTEITS